jgi:hypothetical protein
MKRFTVSVVSSANGIGAVVVALHNLSLGVVRWTGIFVSGAARTLCDFVSALLAWGAFALFVVASATGTLAAGFVQWLVARAFRQG